MAFDEPILTNIFNIAKPYINKETGGAVLRGINTVSYTHLDVYKRQAFGGEEQCRIPGCDGEAQRLLRAGSQLVKFLSLIHI